MYTLQGYPVDAGLRSRLAHERAERRRQRLDTLRRLVGLRLR
jgi:hypothetical protein